MKNNETSFSQDINNDKNSKNNHFRQNVDSNDTLSIKPISESSILSQDRKKRKKRNLNLMEIAKPNEQFSEKNKNDTYSENDIVIIQRTPSSVSSVNSSVSSYHPSETKKSENQKNPKKYTSSPSNKPHLKVKERESKALVKIEPEESSKIVVVQKYSNNNIKLDFEISSVNQEDFNPTVEEETNLRQT